MFSKQAQAKLKAAASGSENGDSWDLLSPQEQKKYIKAGDKVLLELVQTEPDAFSHEGWLELMKKLKKAKKKGER
jgi:hypothetical protein